MTTNLHAISPDRSLEIHRVLGRGGFGAVYLADLHGRDGFVQRVAVKVLSVQMNASADIAARQRDEARLLARLNHDHIVKVFDLTALDGRPTVIMEFVEGSDFGQLLRTGPLPLKVGLQAISQAASALHAAWESLDPATGRPLRVVHRDIKPSNLLLSRHGGLKVLDFGIARGNFDREGQTGSAQFGTTRFMAPEQWLYQTVSDKVDIFALGVTLVDLLAGASLERAPLEPGRFASHMDAAIREVVDPALPSEVKHRLTELLQHMLAFEPEERWTAGQVHERALALADELSGEGLGRFARRVVPALLARPTEAQTRDPLISGAPATFAMGETGTPGTTPMVHPDDETASAPISLPPPQPSHTVPDPAPLPTAARPSEAHQTAPPVPSPAPSPRLRSFHAVVALLVLTAIGLWGHTLLVSDTPTGPHLAPVEERPSSADAPSVSVQPTVPSPSTAPPTPAASAEPPPTAPAEPPSAARASAHPAPARPAPEQSASAEQRVDDAPPARGSEPPLEEPPVADPSVEAPADDPPAAPPSTSPPPPEAAPTERPSVPVTLTSTPIGARVTLDGRLLPGTTPIQLSISHGQHSLVIERDGQLCSQLVSVSPLSAKTLRCDLASSAIRAIR